MRDIKNYIASIDLGTQNIVVMVGQMLSSGKLRVVASSRVATTPGHIVRGEIKNIDVKRSITSALDEIRNNYGLEIKRAYVSLSGQHIICQKQNGYVFIKNSEGAVQQEDIDSLHKSMYNLKLQPGQKIISILPQSYILDGEELVNPIGMLGTQLEGIFNVIIGNGANIDLCRRVMLQCGVEVSELILSSIASSKANLVEGDDELGVMVVDIGAGTTDVAIYSDNNLKYTGVIPIGGSVINKDIRSIGIMEKHIEHMKICYGNAVASTVDSDVVIALPGVGKMSGKEVAQINLANIIEARYMDIITYLHEILNSTNMKHRIISGIVLTGGASDVPNLKLLFERCFDTDIRISSPTEYVDENYHELVEDPMYSTAVGLICMAYEQGDTSIVREFKQTILETEEPEIVIVNKTETPEKPAEVEEPKPQVDLFSQEPELEDPAKDPKPVVEDIIAAEQPTVENQDQTKEPTTEQKGDGLFSKFARGVKGFIQDLDKE